MRQRTKTVIKASVVIAILAGSVGFPVGVALSNQPEEFAFAEPLKRVRVVAPKQVAPVQLDEVAIRADPPPARTYVAAAPISRASYGCRRETLETETWRNVRFCGYEVKSNRFPKHVGSRTPKNAGDFE